MKRKAKTVELLPPLYTGSSTPKFDTQKCLKLLGFENRRTSPSNLGPYREGEVRRPSSTLLAHNNSRARPINRGGYDSGAPTAGLDHWRPGLATAHRCTQGGAVTSTIRLIWFAHT